jgi:hypothetical protein
MGSKVERVKGIEPSYAAWEAAVLPLNYTRVFLSFTTTPSPDVASHAFREAEVRGPIVFFRHSILAVLHAICICPSTVSYEFTFQDPEKSIEVACASLPVGKLRASCDD